MPGASASLRSRRIVLRLREDRAAEKVVEARVAGIVPVELLVGALEEAALAPSSRHSGSVRKVTWAEDNSLAVVISASASARPPRTASASGDGRASRRGPVTGVNGTATCSLG